MNCTKCKSDQIIFVSGKCNDMCDVSYKSWHVDGYVPSGLNIGSGDYIDFSYCNNCGYMQHHITLAEDTIIDLIKEVGDYEQEE